MRNEITNNEYNNKCVVAPSTDIFENANKFILRAEMPGISKENLKVTIDNGKLEISGKIEKDTNKVNNDLKYSEFTLYDYYRSFKIGNEVDTNNISAKLENGVLNLELPKSEAAKPKNIEIANAS